MSLIHIQHLLGHASPTTTARYAHSTELTEQDTISAINQLLFLCVSSTLKDFGLNPKNLGAEIGMTAVLHTHSRKLDYHPHIHVIIPGGGINKAKRQWIKTKGKYLFNEFALAKVFRARILDRMNAAKRPIPCSMPEEWVVD